MVTTIGTTMPAPTPAPASHLSAGRATARPAAASARAIIVMTTGGNSAAYTTYGSPQIAAPSARPVRNIIGRGPALRPGSYAIGRPGKSGRKCREYEAAGLFLIAKKVYKVGVRCRISWLWVPAVVMLTAHCGSPDRTA